MADKAQGCSFIVSNTSPEEPIPYGSCSVTDFLSNHNIVVQKGGTLLFTTEEGNIAPPMENGAVGAAFQAYNEHYPLKLSPDHVWIMITTSLSMFINNHAEEMRSIFVDFAGKKELEVEGTGTIMSANYDLLIDLISQKIEENTKDDIRSWLECNFTTTTRLARTVSKLVLMGAMKSYFSYCIRICCGLPKVILEGTVDDWKELNTRVERLGTWNIPVLTNWSKVLQYVLPNFVNAFNGDIDKDFWNRIAHQTGGGSGPSWLEGWILAFVPFTKEGKCVLNDLEEIKKTNSFGQMETTDVPASIVEVPVTIDDNGTMYKTIFYAGAIMSRFEEGVLSPALDWALFDVTNPKENRYDY